MLLRIILKGSGVNVAVKASEYVLAMSVPYCPVVVLDIKKISCNSSR